MIHGVGVCARLFFQGGAAKLTWVCLTHLTHACMGSMQTPCAVRCLAVCSKNTHQHMCFVPHASGCGCCQHGSLKVICSPQHMKWLLHKALQHTLTGLPLPPLLLLLLLLLPRLLMLLLRRRLLLLPCALPCPRVTRPS